MAVLRAPDLLRTSAQAGGLVLLCYVVLHAALTIALRIGFPYQIEWSEGTSFLQGVVLRDWGVLYPDPEQAQFVPHIYTPLHALLIALLSRVVGDQLPVGRALSVVATLGCAVAAYRWARAVGAGRLGALAGALGFLATFRAVSQWFDLVRVDMVFLWPFTLALAALFGARLRPVAGGVWLAVAYFAKQTPLFYLPPLGLWLLWRHGWRAAVQFGAAAGLALALPLLALHLWTGGWSTFYLFTAVGGHGFDPEPWRKLWPRTFELAVFLLPVLLLWWRARSAAATDWLLLALLSAALAALAYVKHGGYENAWLPLCIGTVPAAALLATRSGAGTLLLGALALALHLKWDGWQAGLLHDHATVPVAEDRAALDGAVAQLRAIPGPVWVADDPWLGYCAGKGIWPLEHLCNELSRPGYVPGPLRAALTGAGATPFTAVVFAEDPMGFPGVDALVAKPRHWQELVGAHFAPDRRLDYALPWAGRCRVGVTIRPGWVHRRRPR